MKLRTILPLLLLTFTLCAPQHTAHAQTNKDWISITTNPYDYTGWRLTFHHFGPNTKPVTAITLTLDTTALTGFPNVRFDGSTGDSGALSFQYGWFPYSSVNADSNWWCNSSGNSILHNQSDSFFVFGLMTNPNTPNAQIYDSAVTIHWFASFESNDCSNYTPISSGSFQVIPTEFQSYTLDTMTATSSTPNCDPIFNFTVHNRNGLGEQIGIVTIESLNIYNAAMRPSDVIAPPGWTLESVTQNSATFSGGNNVIADAASQSNFIVGLMTDQAATAFDFVLHAYDYQGPPIDRDTSWGIPAQAKPCSGTTNSDDTLRVTNNLNCAFSFNLENSHVGNVPVSPIDKFLLHITTPGVTWASASNPSACWSNNAGFGTSTLFWQTPSCAQPGGITQTYHASIDDPTPGELVSVDWIDSNGTTETSRGTSTFRCEAPPTPDSIFVEAAGSCCYRVLVKNAHLQASQTSNIHAVLLEIPGNVGTFSPSCLTSNANWGFSFGSGDTSLQFTAGSGNGLAPGKTDTFFFSTNPKQPNTAWPLTVIDFEAQSGNTITDVTIPNIAGCTAPVICDTVTFKQSRALNTCVDTMTVLSRAIGSGGVDSVWVIPMDGWKVTNGSMPTPWVPAITSTGDTLVYAGGTVNETTSRVFVLSFNADTSLHGTFGVLVITHDVNGMICTSMDSMNCDGSMAVAPTMSSTPLALSVAPNPLRDQTDITLTTGTTDRVRMVLLNVLGQTEQTVVDQMLGAGDHKFTLDATTLPAGTYYLRLETNGQVMTKKLVIEK